MSPDLELSRMDPDWSLHVSDFAPTEWHAQFVTMRLHVKPTTTVKARQFPQTETVPAFVCVELGPHAQVFLSHAQARLLKTQLDFSAGVSEGASPSCASVGEAVTGTSTAPAEPSTQERP